jgi:anaerobic selenocysteine-containing dehydrogenase
LPDWEIFASLALASGGDLGFETLDELHDEMGRLLAPTGPRPFAAPGQPAGRVEVPDGMLQLFSYPLLVDEGRLSERADELRAALGEAAFVEIHTDDAGARGIGDGERVLLRTSAGEVELPARVTEDIAAGSAFVPFNQPGFAANAILAGSFTIAVTLESVSSPTSGPEPAEIGAGGEA